MIIYPRAEQPCGTLITYAMKIGEKLMKARIAKNYSRRWVAEELSISETTYKWWEMDKSYPKPQYLASLAKILDLNVSDLIDPEWRLTVSEPKSKTEQGVALPLLEANARNVFVNMIESQRNYAQYLEQENKHLVEESTRLKKELAESRKNQN